MKTPPWAKSSVKIESEEGQLWQRAFQKIKPLFQKKLSSHNIQLSNIEFLELNPLFQESLPPVGGYYSFESDIPLFLFLPLNTQEFFIEGLLGGGKGELSGFQGTGLLGKKAIESMISSIVELPSSGFESLKEFELTLLTHRLFELKLNLVS
ncbi:MAG: hypothetical protein KC493_17120, partial [Bacteriovoracaceae bacterium]|nr:hypothetical protein [Bacteriovoracaceae bacterium]